MSGGGWDESKHPRVPAGSSSGGEFTSASFGFVGTHTGPYSKRNNAAQLQSMHLLAAEEARKNGDKSLVAVHHRLASEQEAIIRSTFKSTPAAARRASAEAMGPPNSYAAGWKTRKERAAERAATRGLGREPRVTVPGSDNKGLPTIRQLRESRGVYIAPPISKKRKP